jgi:hypothetical protein
VFPRFLDGQIARKGGAHLTQRIVGVYDGRTGMFLYHFRDRFGVKAPFMNGLSIFVKPNGTVGVVTEKVGFNKVIHYRFCIISCTSCSFKELTANVSEATGIEDGHCYLKSLVMM